MEDIVGFEAFTATKFNEALLYIWKERNFHMEITPPPRWRKWLSNIARGLSYRPVRADIMLRELALLKSSGNWLAL